VTEDELDRYEELAAAVRHLRAENERLCHERDSRLEVPSHLRAVLIPRNKKAARAVLSGRDGQKLIDFAKWVLGQTEAMPWAHWRKQDATAKQRYFLRYHGAWREAMTRGEAADAISRIKEAEAARERGAEASAAGAARRGAREGRRR
jgi:hypothetical protein